MANDGPNKLYRNAGDGTLTDSGLLLGSAESHGLDVGDLNGDGLCDLVVYTKYNEPQLLLREAGKYALLKPHEEIELAKRIERGDLAAKDRMINSNLRLVVYNARRYQGQGL